VITVGQALLRMGVAGGLFKAPFDDPDWNAVYAGCESPIERLMCLGIYDYLGYEARSGQYRGRQSIPRDQRAGALVYGQQELDAYRVDFLIVGFVRAERPKVLIVECDGRDFHDDAADRQRDSGLQYMTGFETVRFTGAEISRNLQSVIRRIPDALGKRYAYEIAAAYERVWLPEVIDRWEPDPVKGCVNDGFQDNWHDTL
jgi:very-short-patch-repair endonuclease